MKHKTYHKNIRSVYSLLLVKNIEMIQENNNIIIILEVKLKFEQFVSTFEY